MNFKYLSSEWLKFLEMVLGVRYGADGFYILLAVGVVGLFIVPCLLARWIGSSDRGLVGCFLGMILPVVAVFVGYEMWEMYGAQWFGDAAWVRQSSSLAAIISGVVVLLIVSPLFLGIGIFKTMVVFFVSALIVMGLLGIGQKVVVKDRVRDDARVWYDPRTWKGK